MTRLAITDLSVSADLDVSAMAAVRGGSMGWQGYGYSYSPQHPVNTSDFKFDVTQQLGQSQNTQVNNGNNAAYVCGITSTVNPTQCGSNNINFSH